MTAYTACFSKLWFNTYKLHQASKFEMAS